MKLPRLVGTLLVALCLTTVIYLVAPQQLPVTLYKLSLITVAGVAGYWLDRELFPYARPDAFLVFRDRKELDLAPLPMTPQSYPIFAAAMIRRAIVVAACIIGVGLGA